MKKKQKLLIDKKECSNCGHVLERDIKVCDECGYDMAMEESIMIYAKKYKKIIREQVNPTPAQKSPIIYDQNKKQFMSTVNLGGGTNFLNNPNLKGKEITIADEGEEYTYDPKNKSLSKPSAPVKMDDLKPGDTIKVADEGRKKKKYKYNPWAVCTKSVGRDDMEKYEKCVKDVKQQQKVDEDLNTLKEYIERLITDSEINPKIKKGNFKQFVSKLK